LTDEWLLRFHPDFKPEFREFPLAARRELGTVFDLLREFGPTLGRPAIDTLKGSAYSNMKEIRIETGGNWYRLALAFDPARQAIVLCGGTKGGQSQRLFYSKLIERADRRYAEWLQERVDE
jgi:hypothetical protein